MFKEHAIKWIPEMLKSRCPSEQELIEDYHRNIRYNTLERERIIQQQHWIISFIYRIQNGRVRYDNFFEPVK